MGNILIKVNGKHLTTKAEITIDNGTCKIDLPNGRTYNINQKRNLLLINILGDLGERLLKDVYELDELS